MSDTKLSNVPSMSVGRMIEVLGDSYCSIINNALPLKTMPSVMLWGPPGVGKSQAVRQIASKIESVTGKNVKVTDVRLLLFTDEMACHFVPHGYRQPSFGAARH